jgi:hypothetical protein
MHSSELMGSKEKFNSRVPYIFGTQFIADLHMSPEEYDYVDGTGTGQKRFRSVREYRERKKQQKQSASDTNSRNQWASDTNSINQSPEYADEGSTQPGSSNILQEKDTFVKLLKDTVAHICYSRIGNSDNAGAQSDKDEVPEWRRVSRLISQTLLEKESRMQPELRYKTSPASLREAAIKRISGYTKDYLHRKFPHISNNSSSQY